MRFLRLLAVAWFLLPALAVSQEPVRDTVARGAASDTLRPSSAPGLRLRTRANPLSLARPAALMPAGRFTPVRPPADALAVAQAEALQARMRARVDALWGQRTSSLFSPVSPTAGEQAAATVQGPAPAEQAAAGVTGAVGQVPPVTAGAGVVSPDTTAPGVTGPGVPDVFGEYADVGLQLNARIEAKGERNRNLRCSANEVLIPTSNCQGTFQPQFDFQFGVRTGGVVADRIHLNVDYDSQREFDASNNISVYYEGKRDEMLHRLEVGNVSFAPPQSRFITSGIPSGNYGLQAIGQLGPMRFRTIVAQQKGNVVKDQVYSVGDRTVQTLDKAVEDYQVEARRFFWTVDPRRFEGYPNIDMLDAQAMQRAAAALPPTIRPTRMFVYRLQFTSPPSDPSGPQFRLIGDTASQRGEVYQRLQEGVDYYVDPSQLWIALVRPLTLNQERLVVAYEVLSGQRSDSGGTPDLVYTAADQFANLIWDPSVRPGDPAFYREIRSVYRVGGDDIRRNTISVRVVAGNSGELEKPLGGTAQTFLEMFGLAQRNNTSAFDLENRLWPRPTDANRNPQSGNATIRDFFLVFPSLRPFSDTGLVQPGNPVNEELYITPGEDLYSSRRPQTIYQILFRYQAEGGGEGGTLALGSVQVRPNSERITLDGRELIRNTDYTVDYELGRVTFNGADTLFYAPRQVQVRYEENPLFAAAPTSIFGLATEFPFQNGQVNFTAISQSQRTTFNRPPLGFEPASSLVAGITGNFAFEAEGLSRALERLPNVGATSLSRVSVQGELATSRPQPNAAGQAYVESFEGEGGINIGLNDVSWYYSSQPAAGAGISDAVVDTAYAATMAWQTTPFSNVTGQALQFRIDEIDPFVRTAGTGLVQPEQLLWLTLFPLHRGNLRAPGQGSWTINRPPPPPGTRWWRSIRTPLSATGVDLSRVEEIEFWTYIDTRDGFRNQNPRLVLDFGDISENSLAFGPDTMVIGPSSRPNAVIDTTYFGRRAQGLNEFNTERDSVTRSFQVARNDVGLPGDRIVEPIMQYIAGESSGIPLTNVPICRAQIGSFYELGDTRANCTIANNRLDEEDLNANFNLDIRRGDEALRRYVVNLADESTYDRIGVCNTERDSTGVEVRRRCWVHFRIPFGTVGDGRDVGSPQIRRIKSMRVTVISGEGVPDSSFTTLPIARLKLLGSPWLKRNEQVVAGIAGERPAGGTVAATIVSTTDSASLGYVPPPGVVEGLDNKTDGLTPTGQIQVNERSLRLLATGLDLNERAEAYYRFPEGQKSFMGYQEMRLWARGRGEGWGEAGDLQFFVKIGRDANNFYLHRTPVNAGDGQAPWLPEVRVDFQRFFALRAEIQNAYLQSSEDSLGTCSGIDLAMIGASDRREGTRRYAACSEGYMVYTIDPNTSAPNLAAVQELSVGMVRVGANSTLTDTLELWVDDVRLTEVENTPGYAGQFELGVVAGDIANMRVNFSRQDPHFRQLAEQPTFLSNDVMDVSASVRLERLLPQSIGLALPFSISHARRGTDPLYLSRSDVRGDGIEGLRTPKSNATAMSLDVRRVVPISHPVLGPLLNHVGLTTRLAVGESQSEYREGKSNTYQVGINYNLASRSEPHRLPGWLDDVVAGLPGWLEESAPVRSLRTADYRIVPTAFRFSSDLQRATDRSLSYLKPATVFDGSDEARVVRGLSHVWRNTSALELRPVNAFAMRWDINSLRDLRDYGGATQSAIVAGFERDKLLGVDVGLERERTMGAGISFAPSVSSWFRPRADFGTTFVMARDPNAREVLRELDEPDGELRLPRRLNNGQTFSAGVTMDIGRALLTYTGDSSFIRRFTGLFMPIDVTYSRGLASAYDGTAIDAPLWYQFGLGGPQDFREIDGELAASANRSQNLSASGALRLPLGMTVSNRFLRNDSRLWTRRQIVGDEPFHGTVDNSSTTFPDARLSWNYRPIAARRIISAIGANVAATHSEDRSFRPSETPEGRDDIQTTDTWKYPVSGSITWALAGGFSTSGGFSRGTTERTEPGGTQRLGSTRDMSVDFSKHFKTPDSWGFRNGMQTRVAFQESRTESSLLDQTSSTERQLANSGRYAFNINADTQLSDDLTFTMTGARVITYDKQNNRRFEQTIFSMVFNLTFFAGELVPGGQ